MCWLLQGSYVISGGCFAIKLYLSVILLSRLRDSPTRKGRKGPMQRCCLLVWSIAAGVCGYTMVLGVSRGGIVFSIVIATMLCVLLLTLRIYMAASRSRMQCARLSL